MSSGGKRNDSPVDPLSSNTRLACSQVEHLQLIQISLIYCNVRSLEWFHLSNLVVMLELWYFFFCHQWFSKTFLLILLSDLALCDVVSTQTMEQWPSFSKWVQSSKANQHVRSQPEHIFTLGNISDLNMNTYSPRTTLGALKQNLWLATGSQRTQSQGRFWSMSATSLRISLVEGRLCPTSPTKPPLA